MRTPRATIGGQDSLMQQAANLAKMRDMQTPLLGGENPDLAGRRAGAAALAFSFSGLACTSLLQGFDIISSWVTKCSQLVG
jgi:hypothetical protein